MKPVRRPVYVVMAHKEGCVGIVQMCPLCAISILDLYEKIKRRKRKATRP